MGEGPASGQGSGSGQTPTGSESSTGGQRPGGGKNTVKMLSVTMLNDHAMAAFFLVDDLSELSNNPQFQALRHLIQQNPEQLQTLMQTLQANQPDLFRVRDKTETLILAPRMFSRLQQMIEQRPQEFLELLNQADDGDDDVDDDPLQGGLDAGGAGGQGAPGTVTITLSPQDQQAINRVRTSFSARCHAPLVSILVTRHGLRA